MLRNKYYLIISNLWVSRNMNRKWDLHHWLQTKYLYMLSNVYTRTSKRAPKKQINEHIRGRMRKYFSFFYFHFIIFCVVFIFNVKLNQIFSHKWWSFENFSNNCKIIAKVDSVFHTFYHFHSIRFSVNLGLLILSLSLSNTGPCCEIVATVLFSLLHFCFCTGTHFPLFHAHYSCLGVIMRIAKFVHRIHFDTFTVEW